MYVIVVAIPALDLLITKNLERLRRIDLRLKAIERRRQTTDLQKQGIFFN